MLIASISGIRGTVGGQAGEGLSPSDVVQFASGYGAWILQKHNAPDRKPVVVVGRDARISGPWVRNIVCGTLNAQGIDVVDLGLSTTPTVELAVPGLNADGGLILTASHNPKQWNALKLLNEHGEFLSKDAGERVLALAKSTLTFADVDPSAESFSTPAPFGVGPIPETVQNYMWHFSDRRSQIADRRSQKPGTWQCVRLKSEKW